MRYAKTFSLAVGLVSVLVLPALAFADSGNVGGKPANPREDNPRTQSIFVHEIAPGERVEDGLIVSNNTSETKQVELYPTDAQIASGGAFACEQKADQADQEGSWIKLDKTLVELEANQSETVNFTIAVPKEASVGEHNACIAIQAIEPATESGVNGVTLSFRSAIRVAITVPGDYKKGLAFESLRISDKGKDDLLVNQRLRNNGNVSLDADLDTSLRSILGTRLAQDGGEFPVLSGQQAEFNFVFKKPIWGGWYKVVANATYDSSTQTSLGEQGGSKETIGKSSYIFVTPHPVISISYAILVILIAAAVAYVKMKKNKEKILRKKAIKHTVQKGEEIVSLSTIYGAAWKQTVKLNKLRPPYVLEPGTELLVVPSEDYKPTTEKPETKEKTTAKKSKTKTTATKKSSSKPASKKTKQSSATKKTNSKTSKSATKTNKQSSKKPIAKKKKT